MPLKIMSLTDAAAARVREIIADSENPVVGVRVGIRNAGCAGQAYTLDYRRAGERRRPGRGQGRHVFVEPKATLFLLGTVIDYESQARFELHLQEPQPDRRMRLRRERAAQAGDLKALAEARSGATA